MQEDVTTLLRKLYGDEHDEWWAEYDEQERKRKAELDGHRDVQALRPEGTDRD